jgi:segregation and condensation protein A
MSSPILASRHDADWLDYRVELEVFSGPLDLLLYLVEKSEVDIFDIPIARITEQYLDCLRRMEWIDMELAGEFLLLAATLMEIKSQMLLPDAEEHPESAEQEDPRQELVQKLLEYRRFREAASLLEELAKNERAHYTRLPMRPVFLDSFREPSREALRDAQVWDLVAAFGRLMREAAALAPAEVVYDDTPIQVYMDRILELVTRKGQFSFSELFRSYGDRARIVGVFLALLELVRQRSVRVEQRELFGEIWILRAESSVASPPPGLP